MQRKKSGLRTAVFSILTIALMSVPGALANGKGQSQYNVDSASAGSGTFTVLYNFGSHSGDPLYPQYQGVIAQGRDGNLYSTSPYGGTSNYGTVFKMTPTGNLTVLYDFGSDVSVGSGLTLGADGNFYGATFYGGDDYGTVFKIAPGGKMTMLYNFTGQDDDAYPAAPPIEGTDGNFYGTAAGDFYGNGGEVYKMTPSGSKVTLFHLDHQQGAAPVDPLVQGTDGNFYGTTSAGGNNSDCEQTGCGVVFRITPDGAETVLHNFSDAFYPVAPLIEGDDGKFYGTVPHGGPPDYGVVFKMTPAGRFTILHIFQGGTDGIDPTAGLLQATDGNFYGVTAGGGESDTGTLYKITPGGKYSVLYSFPVNSAYPEVTLVQHTNGKIYGDTFGYPYNYGTFFSFDLGLGPFVRLVSTSGEVGKSIGILGQGLTGTSGVSFNGHAAKKFDIVSDTYLTATVPDGATTGFVSVTTPGGKLKSNIKFRVTR